MDTEAQSASGNLRGWMIALTLLLVPAWLVVAWVLVFALGMSVAVEAEPSFLRSFDFRHVALIVLAVPALALAIGWQGYARQSRATLLAGVVLLAGWLLMLPATYLYLWIAGNAEPGSFLDRDYRIPANERQAYRMVRFGHVLALRFSSPKAIFPDAPDGARLPLFAHIEIGTQSFPALAAKDGSACDGQLREASPVFRAYQDGDLHLMGNFLSHNPEFVSALYRSPDGAWMARCETRGVCTVLFRSAILLTEFAIQREYLCRAPQINRRLADMANGWVR